MLLEEPTVDLAELAQLARMFEQHRPRLLAMLAWRSDPRFRARRDPEEIIQQAYLRAQDRWDDFKRSGLSPYAWLYRLVQDCLLDDYDYQTRGRRDPRAEVAWPDRSSMQLIWGLVGKLTSPSEAAAKQEYLDRLRLRVQQTLGLLSPDFREVLCMHFFDQMSQKEIGEVLGISHDAARKRYTRARLAFRDLWNGLARQEGWEP